jgi:hypothetical protein
MPHRADDRRKTVEPIDNSTALHLQRPSTPPLMRASDADRNATVEILQDALTRGLLRPDEASDRMGTAFATVHLQDLAGITADLPKADSPKKPIGWRPLWLALLAQLQYSLTSALTGPRRRVRLGVLVLLLLLFAGLGVLAAHALLDGVGGPDFGPDRFGRGDFGPGDFRPGPNGFGRH